MNREEKERAYWLLCNKSSYDRTPEDAAEIRRLNRELFCEGESDAKEINSLSKSSEWIRKISTQYSQQDYTDKGREIRKNFVRDKTNLHNTAGRGEMQNQINNEGQWSRLLNYYAECLIRENRQQYVINNWHDNIFQLQLGRTQAHEFIQGTTRLEYLASRGMNETPLAKYLGVGRRRRATDQQLCFGYPMFVVNEQSVAPLIIATLNYKVEDTKIYLEIEDYEICYAALESLHLQEEEIASILDACDRVESGPDHSILEALELELIRQISNYIGHTISLISCEQGDGNELKPGQLYDIAGLFWVKTNIATANLIDELHSLSEPSYWDSAPGALKELLSHVPEREYLEASAFRNDDEIYVTVVNDQQRRAISTGRSENLSVITGPPGTGKSQLVLNLVAQALLHNQSVLFASRNNKAVDVVMARLQNEIAFPGCVRTGNKANREKAAIKMRAALSQAVQASPPTRSKDRYQYYREIKDDILEEEATLHNVRDLIGLISSYTSEQHDISQLLPPEVTERITDICKDTYSDEVDHLLDMLSNFRLQALNLRERETRLTQSIQDFVINNQFQSPLIKAIKDFETQWGAFGGRLLSPRMFRTLADIQTYLLTWENALPAFEIREQIICLRNARQQLQLEYEAYLEHISGEMHLDVEILVEVYQFEELQDYLKQTRILNSRGNTIATGNLPLWESILAWLHLRNPSRLLKIDLENLIKLMKLDPEKWIDVNGEDISLLNQSSFELCQLLSAAQCLCLMKNNWVQLSDLDKRLQNQFEDLPKALAEDINRIEIGLGVTELLYPPIKQLVDELKDLIRDQDQLIDRVNNKSIKNDDNFELLKIILADQISSRSEHQGIKSPVNQVVIIETINYWRNLILLWKTIAGLRALRDRLKSLPPEPDLIDKVKQLQAKMLANGAEIIRATWQNNVQNLNTETIQEAYDFISAVEQLCGPYNQESYGQLKEAEKKNFPSALRIFPIWATTNLAAKTNLPLIPGLFDVVVIDEASQCDIPSALPLLYRAKHILIIGDPNQLRHVATLYKNSDIDAAMKLSIATEAFLYNTHSLFDLAQRSVGSSPGTLLLNEHYRSDFRIIEFSNQEFYDNRLAVRTDLKRRGIPIRFLNAACGIYWLHTQGSTIRPPNGGAYNVTELERIRDLIPRIKESLNNYGMHDASIGIVTPYREQEKRLYELLPDDQNTTVGTAHKFQGDECDVVIFSPVLAPGISDGSLHWLEQTINLLNVSVSRPRCTLLIVGDWDFCHNLPTESKYRRLADYVLNQQAVFQSLDDLPFLNREPINPIGRITDPLNREYNRTTIRKFLTSCSDYIWWMDGYFNDHVFDLILDLVQQPDFNVQEIRLLTSKEQVEPSEDRGSNIKTEKALHVQKELSHHGIRFDLGYLPKKDLPHDRFLYSHNQAINMPPFGGVYGDHKMLSEYTKTSTKREFFDSYWTVAVKVDQS